MPNRALTVEMSLPPREAKPGTTGHWYGKSGAIAAYRADCAERFARAAREAGFAPIRGRVALLHLQFYYGVGRSPVARAAAQWYAICRDDDSAMATAKPLRDSLQDAGLIANDSYKYLRIGTVLLHTRKADHGGRMCVVARLEETEEPVK